MKRLRRKPKTRSQTDGSPFFPPIQKKEMTVEEEAVQTKEAEEETVQQKEEEETVQKAEMEEETVQKKQEETEEPVQKAEKEEDTPVMTKKDGSKQGNTSIEYTLSAQRGKGTTMDADTKTEMENKFGTDFNNVTIHNDAKAKETSQELGAQAFTTGNDIYFNEGKYNPNSREGKHLLAHELTHTIQQQKDTVQLYRDKKATNFGSQDSGILKEDSFDFNTDKEKKPWIKKIIVNLDKTPKKDKNGQNFYTGTLVASYYANKVALSDIVMNVSAGSDTHKTEEANHLVHRIEGQGYMSSSYSAPYTPDPKNKRYSNDKLGNMTNAVFFKGSQAIHEGPLDQASHGCVHAGWHTLKQLNYHSVKGHTAVVLQYV